MDYIKDYTELALQVRSVRHRAGVSPSRGC